MNIYLDTNILMDVFIGETRPNYRYSIAILNALKIKPELTGFVSVQSVTDIAYCFTKHEKEQRSVLYQNIKKLLLFLKLVTFTQAMSEQALKAEPRDFEDLEQILCAESNNCSWFITGDKELLKTYGDDPKRINVISPEEFFRLTTKKN